MVNAQHFSPTLTRTSDLARWLTLGAVIGPILFVAAFMVGGVLRPGYSPIHQAVSDLGVGTNGWLLDSFAVINGVLLITFAAAFATSMRKVLSPGRRWSSAVLLALPGCGFAIAGIFTEAPATLTIHWEVGANLMFIGAPAAFLVAGLALRRAAQWHSWGTALLIVCAVTVVLICVMFWVWTPGTPLAPLKLGGLMERLAVIEIEAWYVVLGWRLFRGVPDRSARQG